MTDKLRDPPTIDLDRRTCDRSVWPTLTRSTPTSGIPWLQNTTSYPVVSVPMVEAMIQAQRVCA